MSNKTFKIKDRITDKGTESIKKYLSDISSIDMFESAEEEHECAVRASLGDEESRMLLVKKNLRFVISVAKSYIIEGVSLEDLINEGNIGLIEASEKYDPNVGVKFITYAIHYIKRGVLNYIALSGRTIRIPMNRNTDILRLNKKISVMEQELCRNITANDLIDEMDDVDLIYMIRNQSVSSLNDVINSDDDDMTVGDIIADRNSEQPDDWLIKISNRNSLMTAISKLKPIEIAVICNRYGLNDYGKELTYEECSELESINLSVEKVKKIEKLAIMKLGMRRSRNIINR